MAGVAIQCSSDLFLFAWQLLLSGADYFKVFQTDQLQALAMFFLDLREKGFLIAQLFYGAWLFPLGYLVFKSGFLPKIFGYRADGSLFYLDVDLLSVFPLPRLHGNHLCKLSAWIHCGIWAYFVASDHGRKRAEICLS